MKKLTRRKALAYVRAAQRVFEVRPDVWCRAMMISLESGRCCVIGGASALLWRDLHGRAPGRVDVYRAKGERQALREAITSRWFGALMNASDTATDGTDAARRIDAVLKELGA